MDRLKVLARPSVGPLTGTGRGRAFYERDFEAWGEPADAFAKATYVNWMGKTVLSSSDLRSDETTR